VQWLVVTRLIGLASDEAADPGVRAVASHALASIAHRIETASGERGAPPIGDPHAWAVALEIRRFLNRPDPAHQRAAPSPSPPGDPIGGKG
jgi:hypothetical protein